MSELTLLGSPRTAPGRPQLKLGSCFLFLPDGQAHQDAKSPLPVLATPAASAGAASRSPPVSREQENYKEYEQ